MLSFHAAERRGKLVNFKVKKHLLPPLFKQGKELKITCCTQKIIGVILFRVSIPDTASVNSEANFLKHIFQRMWFFKYVTRLIILRFPQHTEVLTLSIPAPRPPVFTPGELFTFDLLPGLHLCPKVSISSEI